MSFILYVILYIVVSIVITKYTISKVKTFKKDKRVLITTGVTAFFFSPAFIPLGYIPMPAPPAIGFVYFIRVLFSPEHHFMLFGIFVFAFIPYMIFWLLYFLVTAQFTKE